MEINATIICNLGLGRLGDHRIGNIKTPEAGLNWKLCHLFYEQTRNEVEAMAEWVCCKHRADLGAALAGADVPAFGWDYAYSLATDPPCLRVLRQVDADDDTKEYNGKREGDRWLTNEDTCYILYLRELTDPKKMGPLLVEAIYTRMAEKMAFPITGDRNLAAMFFEELEKVILPRARGMNAIEGKVFREKVTKWSAVK